MGLLHSHHNPLQNLGVLVRLEHLQLDLQRVLRRPIVPDWTGTRRFSILSSLVGKRRRYRRGRSCVPRGAADRGDSRFRTYSLGMKQRLGLAYALLGDPELLFLDEPTNGMDPAGMAEVRDLIRSLGTGGRTVLLSSHLLHEVEQVCDSVGILSKGKLIVQGKVADLVHSRGGERVRLRTTDNAKAVEVLSALDWVDDVSADGESVVVTAPGERSPELSMALGRSEVYVTEMAAEEMSLEQYFLDVTGDDQAG